MASGWGIETSGMVETQAMLTQIEEEFAEIGRFRVVASDSEGPVEYAIYVEFGTYKMAANAALRNSIGETMANLQSVVAGADEADDIPRLIAEDIAEGWQDDVWVDTGRLRDSIHVEEVSG